MSIYGCLNGDLLAELKEVIVDLTTQAEKKRKRILEKGFWRRVRKGTARRRADCT